MKTPHAGCKDAGTETGTPGCTVLLDLQNVAKAYPSPEGQPAVEVLRAVSLQVAPGDFIAIVGPSGSGKSTLLNIMGALDRPTSGTVLLAGHDLSGLADAALARIRNRDMGFVFQFHHLLPQCTVLENVLLPTLAESRPASRELVTHRAMELLDRVGLAHRSGHKPGQISGGECQRVAVVRALINRPQLVLADEPTGSLDATAAAALAEFFVELNTNDGIALVLVTHSARLAARARQRYLLNAGRLAAQA